MCMGGGVKTPKIEKTPVAPPIVAPMDADQEVKKAGDEERRRRMAATGRSDTILTSSLGSSGYTASGGKTLLGQ